MIQIESRAQLRSVHVFRSGIFRRSMILHLDSTPERYVIIDFQVEGDGPLPVGEVRDPGQPDEKIIAKFGVGDYAAIHDLLTGSWPVTALCAFDETGGPTVPLDHFSLRASAAA